MNLKDFVSDVILQICSGVTEAINKHDKEGSVGKINPAFKEKNGKIDWRKYVKDIEFDISVTEDDKISGKAGGGLKVYFITANASADNSKERSMVNRIKFTIPVSLPAHAVDP